MCVSSTQPAATIRGVQSYIARWRVSVRNNASIQSARAQAANHPELQLCNEH